MGDLEEVRKKIARREKRRKARLPKVTIVTADQGKAHQECLTAIRRSFPELRADIIETIARKAAQEADGYTDVHEWSALMLAFDEVHG